MKIMDVKTFSNDPKVKYHGRYNKDGFGVVIRNLSEADLNVTYLCIYGFDQSTPNFSLSERVDSIPCSFTSTFFLTRHILQNIPLKHALIIIL
jgi:hypothetical protein